MDVRRHDWPNVWGAGQLLGFSGLDGPVDFTHQLVLHTGEAPGRLHVRLPLAATIELQGAADSALRLLLGDVMVWERDGEPWRVAFESGQRMIGELPPGGALVHRGEAIGPAPVCLARDGRHQLWACSQGRRWVLYAMGDDEQSPQRREARLHEGLGIEIAAIVSERSRFVAEASLPPELPRPLQRLARKALSVQKVNLLSPHGRIRRLWTTPDRWPHRHMWLWDSAFQSVGLAHVAPRVAQQTLLAMLDQVQPDGFLPHTVVPDGAPSSITQPPILAWAVETVAGLTDDEAFVAECVEPLLRYLAWDRRHRGRHGDGLLAWDIEGDCLCRSGESGMDNSPRFDAAAELDAVDFSAYLAHDYACLARLLDRLGRAADAEACREAARCTAVAINRHLWCDRAGFYMDRDRAGRLTGIKAVSGFVPMWAGIAPAARVRRLVAHLDNPATFGTAFPVPSVALDQGVFSKDMWRGPSWINMNWLIIEGLRRYGYDAQADRLRDQTLATLARWYEQEGALFEFYDALDLTTPRDLDRKRRLASGEGLPAISDYHWTASAVIGLTKACRSGWCPSGVRTLGRPIRRRAPARR